MSSIIPIEKIEKKIYIFRGQRVMLDSDLAELYEVEIRGLNQAVKRNTERFPKDFMFQLTREEYDSLRSQIVTLKQGRGRHRKYMPYVFTEQGVAMLSGVLNSKHAIKVNIQIMRAFIKLREMIMYNNDLKTLIEKVEKQGLDVKDNKENIHKLAILITQMLTVKKDKKSREIGF